MLKMNMRTKAFDEVFANKNFRARTSSDDVDEIIMDVKITTTDGREVIGKINFVMPDDGTLSYFAMTENLLTETGLSADYWVEKLNASSNGRIARTQGCFAKCKPMKKGKGKGTCKAECWLDIAVKVATVVAVVAVL